MEHATILVSLLLIVLAIAAQIWTEHQFKKGNNLICSHTPNVPCNIRIQICVVSLNITRFTTLANIVLLIFTIIAAKILNSTLVAYIHLPVLLLIGSIIYFGCFWHAWGKMKNGRSK